jgi:hypothetical protein
LEILSGSRVSADDRAIVGAIEGMAIGAPPPADMPEPLIMAVYPSQAGHAPGCGTP